MKRLFGIASICLFASAGYGQINPSTTKVLFLPSLNTSGDKYKKMVEGQIKEADDTLRRLFGERGFVLATEEDGRTALTKSGIDFTDEENHRKDILYKIGEEAGTDLIVFTIITRTWQKTTQDLFFDKLEGFATMKTWVLDVKNKKPLVSGTTIEGVSRRNGPTGSLRQIRAVRIGLESQLKEFLQPFAKIPDKALIP